jgi:hypothetical protein
VRSVCVCVSCVCVRMRVWACTYVRMCLCTCVCVCASACVCAPTGPTGSGLAVVQFFPFAPVDVQCADEMSLVNMCPCNGQATILQIGGNVDYITS